MAKVRIRIVKARTKSLSGGLLQVPASIPDAAQEITSSGANQVADTLTAREGQLWEIEVSGGAVDVAFGTAPVAGADAKSRRIEAGQTRFFGASIAGEKCAVKDAA